MAARRQQKTRAAARSRPITMRGDMVPRKRGGRGPVPGTDFPSNAGAPPAVPPIETRADQRAVAPWPLIDRYPFIIGTSLTATYLAACVRLAITGYRQQWVDLLDELLAGDPHLFSVISKRVLSTANGRLEIKPVSLPEDHPDRELAQETAEMVQQEVDRIPNLTQTIATLLWGIYYGVTSAETFWTRDSDGWHVERFDFIHSRRLSYPDPQAYTLFIWDQGQVLGSDAFGTSPTNRNTFGTPIADWPGKFLTYAPQLRGDYPTREGLGQQTSTFALFKRAGVRGAMGYLERFAKGFLEGTYATQSDGKPREATPEDQGILEDALRKVGPGSGSFAMIPDSCKITPKGYEGTGTSKIGYDDWVKLCDGQNSKAVLGGTLATDHEGSGGLGGSGTAEVQERAEVDLEQYDATCFAESFRRDVVYWFVKMNKPEGLRVLPQVFVNVDREPDAKTILDNSLSMTKIGGRVDLDKVSAQTGIALIQQEPGEDGKMKPRGSFLSDVIAPEQVHDDLMSDEAKDAQKQKADNDQKAALIKAQQPPMAPGGAGGKQPAAGKGGKQPAKKKPKGKTTLSLVLSTEEQHDNDEIVLLLKNKSVAEIGDRSVAVDVYEALLLDYPAKALTWIPTLPWTGVLEIPIDEIDFSNASKWRASHEDISSYVEKVKKAKGDWKPIVLVKTPGNPKFIIVDGHHRTLAYQKLGWPVRAYVAHTPVNKGPWDELHDMQKKGSSKGSWANEDSPSWRQDNMPSWAKRPASYEGPGTHPLEMTVRPDARLPAAAIAVVFDEEGRILTVSRPEGTHEQAFPGGMLDPGETIERACARELFEETGLLAETGADGEPIVEPLFVTNSPTDGRALYVFRVPKWMGEAYAAEPATTVEWMAVADFFAQSRLFRDTIRELMARDLLTPATADVAAQ